MKLFKTWEEDSFKQIAVERLLKQIVKLYQKTFTDYAYDLELGIDEVLSISKDYQELSQGIMYMFDNFFP